MDKQFPSNKKLISIHEEKLIRAVNYDTPVESPPKHSKKLLLEIFQKGTSGEHPSQKVIVSIKPKAPAIKTIYLTEKARYQTKKVTEKSRSRLAVGDHLSIIARYPDGESSNTSSSTCSSFIIQKQAHSEVIAEKTSTSNCREQIESYIDITQWSNSNTLSQNASLRQTKQICSKQCRMYAQPQLTMTCTKTEKALHNTKKRSGRVDISPFVSIKNTSEDLFSSNNLCNLKKRIENLERKVLKENMGFPSVDPKKSLLSCNKYSKHNTVTAISSNEQPGCSYVEYSHIPETSAFQRYSQQPAPLSASKATTIQKEHNSEQYGRDFTLYDGITSRGRRQCASVPCKRNDGPKMAADRVHKIRHKLNPVRDYRLMDTVHYLAQGEFAPRDDGIKLTPSREAVLSDIIWEDVCRTHWPNTRLANRVPHPERYGTRSDLQRLIDSLLRERIAHVERRRRRHYRIVKLNHRHENCRLLGKTGDIIVASNKARSSNDNDASRSTKKIDMNQKLNISNSKKRGSYDRSQQSEPTCRKFITAEDCTPGPSYVRHHSKANKDSTCCYHTLSPSQMKNISLTKNTEPFKNVSSDSCETAGKIQLRNPRLVVKKKSSQKKYNKVEPNLEHFILLPTLVVKTSSNMKRQKKFNALYHRILNLQLTKAQVNNSEVHSTASKRDVGINIDETCPNSEECYD